MSKTFLHELLQFYRLDKAFESVGYFETEQTKKLCLEIQTLIESHGQLIALTGIIGSGKTTICENICANAIRNRRILVSNSWSVDLKKVNMGVLMRALFYDLSTDKRSKLPNKSEDRERMLCSMIKKKGKPVVIFVDEAHKLHSKTLFALKRLLEVVRRNNGNLSIVLVGLPKLDITLKNPAFEEIGARSKKLTVDIISGQEKEFIEWMLSQCAKPKVKPTDIFTQQAINLLAEKLRTPLQIIYYGWQTVEVAYKAGAKTVDIDSVRRVLKPNVNGLQAALARQGYDEKTISEMLDVKRKEIRAFLRGKLSTIRTEELHSQLLGLGILQIRTG